MADPKTTEVRKQMVLLHLNDGLGVAFRNFITAKLKDEFGQAQRIQQGNSAHFNPRETEPCDVLVTDSVVMVEAYKQHRPQCEVRYLPPEAIAQFGKEEPHGSETNESGAAQVSGIEAQRGSTAASEAPPAAAPIAAAAPRATAAAAKAAAAKE